MGEAQGQSEETAVPQEARMWATFCHLAALAGLIFPFGNIVGPLVVWLVKREEMPFVDSNGKGALNFQISMSIYNVLSILLCFVFIGIPILVGLILLNLICIVLASVKANKGETFSYPITIPFIK